MKGSAAHRFQYVPSQSEVTGAELDCQQRKTSDSQRNHQAAGAIFTARLPQINSEESADGKCIELEGCEYLECYGTRPSERRGDAAGKGGGRNEQRKCQKVPGFGRQQPDRQGP